GVPGHLLAVRHGDPYHYVAGRAVPFGDRVYRFAHQPARHRVDRGLAHVERQPGAGHRTDTLSRLEGDPATVLARPDRGHDQRAVGDVRVVSGVLDYSGTGRTHVVAVRGQRETRPSALGQRHIHRVGELAGQQR